MTIKPRRLRSLVLLLATAAATMLLTGSARAQPVDPQAWCDALPGVWDAPTCRVAGTVTVAAGEVLEVPENVTLELTRTGRLIVEAQATFRNTGRIESGGQLENRGTVDNQGVIAGVLLNRASVISWGELLVTRTLNNDGSGVIDLRGFGRMTIESSGYLINAGQARILNGSLHGRDSTTITNSGRILNEGTISSDANATLDNEVGGRIENVGTISHLAGTLTNRGGVITNNGYGSFGALGTIDNHADVVNVGLTGLIANGNVLTNHPGATLDNRATLANGCIDFDGTLYCNPEIPMPGVLTNGGTLDNAGQLDNHGTLDTSGQLTNTGVVTNDVQLTNTGSVRNVTTWQNTGTLDTIGGTFTNEGELRADCAGSILGSIDDNAPLSSCVRTTPLTIADAASCAQVAGLWTTVTSECSIGTLVSEDYVEIADGVRLIVLTRWDARDRVVMRGVLDVRGVLHLTEPDGFERGMDITETGVLINRGTVVMDARVNAQGQISNRRGAELTVGVGKGMLAPVSNQGEIDVVGRMSLRDSSNGGLIRVLDGGTLTTFSGRLTNTPSGVIEVDGGLNVGAFGLDTATTLDNAGLITNRGATWVDASSRLVLKAGGTFAHEDGASFINNGFFGVEEDATFFSEANTFFVNAGEGIVEVAGDFFSQSTLDQVGDWITTAQGAVFNLVGLSFHNHGTYTNHGLLQNSGATSSGRFTNAGQVLNELGGTIANGTGRFENGPDGLVRNAGVITVDEGVVVNDGTFVAVASSTLEGTLTGALPVTIVSSSGQCRDGGWETVVTADGLRFEDEAACTAWVLAVTTTVPDGLSRTDQLGFLADVLDGLAFDDADPVQRHDAKEVVRAVEALQVAVDGRWWADADTLDARRGDMVFEEVERALQDLAAVRSVVPELVPVADQLVAITRDLAATAIEAAQVADGDQRNVDKAARHLADADEAQTDGRLDKAVKAHRKAWTDAMKALD